MPLTRLDPEFFELRNGLAGAFFQKLQNYRKRLVVLGDIAEQIAASKSLHDFVHETNRVPPVRPGSRGRAGAAVIATALTWAA